MANSKRMIEDLRELALEDKINPNTFNRLMASAIADLYEKVNEMEYQKNLSIICTEIKDINMLVAVLKVDTKTIKNRLDTNPAIQWGDFVDKHPAAIKFVFGLTLLFIAGNGIQTLIDLIKTVFGL